MKRKAILLELLIMALAMTAVAQSNKEDLSLDQLKLEKKNVDKKLDSLKSIASKTSEALTKTGNDLVEAKANKAPVNKITELQNREKKQQTIFEQQLVLLDSLSGMQYYLDSVIKKKIALSKGNK